ncbi:MAG: hypothetical protein KKB37_07065, partial [Alphaproteobacteria bacterium]|nr:hypothetical protein [Alphaproteobacteria bacterium]
MQLLDKHGISAVSVPYTEMSSRRLKSTDPENVAAVVLSYMGVGKRLTHLKSVIARVRRTCPDAMVVAGLWSEPAAEVRGQSLEHFDVDRVATSLRKALAVILDDAHDGPREGQSGAVQQQ